MPKYFTEIFSVPYLTSNTKTTPTKREVFVINYWNKDILHIENKKRKYLWNRKEKMSK